MRRILVINDEEQMLQLLSHVLQRAGYSVSEAHNGNEGLRSFKESPPDLVITDIYMPEKEGLETIQEIRSLSSTIRIIAMSGGSPKVAGFPTLTVARTLGADYTIAVPFKTEELLQLVSLSLAPSAESTTR